VLTIHENPAGKFLFIGIVKAKTRGDMARVFCITAGFMLLFFSGSATGQTADSVWQRSLKKFGIDDYHGAIEDLDLILRKFPGTASALYNRGIARLNLGDTEGACNDLNLARNAGSRENRLALNYICDEDYLRDMMIKEYYKKEKVYPEFGYRPKYTKTDSLRGTLNPDRTCFDVQYYDLRVKVIPAGKKIEGLNSIYFKVVEPTKTIQIDLLERYKVTSVTMEGSAIPYRRTGNVIYADFPQTLNPGETHTVTIAYNGKPIDAPNPPWDGGFVWKKDKNKDFWLGVACEHLGASSWWPNKDHLSDKPDSMQIAIEIPAGYQAVCNGNLRRVEPVGRKNNLFTWFVSYPINNYNVTFYAGKYTAFSDTLTEGGDTLLLDYNVLTYNLDAARRHFAQTKEVISFYNKAFGFYPYRRDGFGLVESSYEGMEHQSAIAYGNGYDKNSGDEYRNKMYDYIIVHEAAHEWWGNSVTAADMADAWIHEGFATYAELMFLENRFGKDEYMYELFQKGQYIFNIWPLVQNRGVNENTFASNDIYNKGAMVLHCLRCAINNDSLFFGMIHDFSVKYRYHTVNSDDFIRFVDEYTGTDYTAFFKKYLYETRLPMLEYRYTRENGNLKLLYHWTEVDASFSLPFGIGTDTKKSYRLTGTTEWQEMLIPETGWFKFFNLMTDYEGCPDNAFTYFRTRCINDADPGLANGTK
jgi:aminopeptidase N